MIPVATQSNLHIDNKWQPLRFSTYGYLFRLPGPAVHDQCNNQPARGSLEIVMQPIFLFCFQHEWHSKSLIYNDNNKLMIIIHIVRKHAQWHFW